MCVSCGCVYAFTHTQTNTSAHTHTHTNKHVRTLTNLNAKIDGGWVSVDGVDKGIGLCCLVVGEGAGAGAGALDEVDDVEASQHGEEDDGVAQVVGVVLRQGANLCQHAQQDEHEEAKGEEQAQPVLGPLHARRARHIVRVRGWEGLWVDLVAVAFRDVCRWRRGLWGRCSLVLGAVWPRHHLPCIIGWTRGVLQSSWRHEPEEEKEIGEGKRRSGSGEEEGRPKSIQQC